MCIGKGQMLGAPCGDDALATHLLSHVNDCSNGLVGVIDSTWKGRAAEEHVQQLRIVCARPGAHSMGVTQRCCAKEEVDWSVQDALAILGGVWQEPALAHADLIVCLSLSLCEHADTSIYS